MGYLIYLILFHQISSFFLSAIPLYLSTKILLNKKYKKDLSPTMILYFFYAFLHGISAIPYYGYCIAFWRPEEENIYNEKLLFIFGFLPFVLININCLLEFFLCLDRCLAILFLNFYGINYQKYFVAFSTLICIGLFYIYFIDIFPGFPILETQKCMFFSCFLGNSNFVILLKGIQVGLNFIAAIILAVLIKFKLNPNNGKMNRITKTIIIIIAITIFNEFIPYAASEISMKANNQRLAPIIGPYGATISTLSVSLSTGMYYKSVKNNSANSTSA